ncbi:hypothetical protein SAMN05444007_10662 [Cribrihabitans marinus]|uniref:Uncharacterized protein n=1 Tax=Cribrihabitans marinus TaxID=1227549 RepID=A0A1H7ATZ8_9RHOB|nr:hypothetical protein [Cribrihabitans marinus]SEJ65572.1 hypothetical protein SAMN05444007_10662 [Cribrihabitans marinus]
MLSEEVEALFTRENGDFVFARWGRPLAPMAVGVTDDSLAVIKGAFEAVTAVAGHEMVDADPELGSNCIFFFFQDWAEMRDVPELDRVMPDLEGLIGRLEEAKANQYRAFRFDEKGAILAAYIFLKMDAQLSDVPADVLSLSQVAQTILCWSDTAFQDRSPLATADGVTILRPDVSKLIRAAYDPALPNASRDPSLALRLHARMEMEPAENAQ